MTLGPVLIGIQGLSLCSEERDRLLHPAVGGVVLFSRNYKNPEQLRRLCNHIRGLRQPRLLLAVDQEGGRVQRLREGFTDLPPLGSLGKLYRQSPEQGLDFAYRHGRVMASEVLAHGIDLSFAPVLDLAGDSQIIGDRAFSIDPAAVVALGQAYLAGMHDAGMGATGKHFPGHGSVLPDSHTDDVADDRPLTAIADQDLRPFIDLKEKLDALMIAHVSYPQVDSLPAGYSHIWLQQILRRQLGYQGVIISDDLGMHAAKTVGSLQQRTDRCLQAGCDLALICMPEDVAEFFAGAERDWPDRSQIIKQLYGRPTVAAEQLTLVPEFRQWRLSLSGLDKQWT